MVRLSGQLTGPPQNHGAVLSCEQRKEMQTVLAGVWVVDTLFSCSVPAHFGDAEWETMKQWNSARVLWTELPGRWFPSQWSVPEMVSVCRDANMQLRNIRLHKIQTIMTHRVYVYVWIQCLYSKEPSKIYSRLFNMMLLFLILHRRTHHKATMAIRERGSLKSELFKKPQTNYHSTVCNPKKSTSFIYII